MENFFYNNDFYSDLESFINENFEDENEIKELEDDVEYLCKGSILEPMLLLSPEWITNRIDDDRFSENDSDRECEKITKVLNDNIDYAKINDLMPKLYYENYRDRFIITKQDLLNSI